ncbi:MAG: PAS domain S-box protein [Jatrophihabitans sp.]
MLQSLLNLHLTGCSAAGLDELAGALAGHCGFRAVLITLTGAWAGTELEQVGRAGRRGAVKALLGRHQGPDADPMPVWRVGSERARQLRADHQPARLEATGQAGGATRSWPVPDLVGLPVGRLDCLLDQDVAPPDAAVEALIEQACYQLGAMVAAQLLRHQVGEQRRQLVEERVGRRQAERALGLVFEESAIGMATASLSAENPGRLLGVNDALCHLTGRTEAELLQLTMAELTHPADRAIGNSALRRAMAGRRTPVRSRRRLLHTDGSHVWAQVTACPLFDDSGRPLHALLQIEDLSPRQDAEVELAARQDPLTGLLTGQALDQAMVQVLDRARRLDTTGAVLICELTASEAGDGETHSEGGAGGNSEQRVRQAVAQTLGRTLRNGDLIARIAENRFAIVAEEVRPEHAGSLAGRIVEAMAGRPDQLGSVDIGVAVLTPRVSDPQLLYHQATSAMLEARRTGQSFVLYSRPEDSEQSTTQLLYSRPGWTIEH